jgi:hypothetical protein
VQLWVAGWDDDVGVTDGAARFDQEYLIFRILREPIGQQTAG